MSTSNDSQPVFGQPVPGIAPEPRLRAINRQQLLMRTIDVEQLIAEDHPARALWEFTGRLDLTRFYECIKSVAGCAGQPSLDPRLMIALWLYAYSRGIGSAREVSRMCAYEPGLQWLCGLEPINHHSLSDFRVEHEEALTEMFTQVLGVLSAEGLITLERVMHDGTRIGAAASGNTFRSEETLREHLRLAKEQVAAMGDPRLEPADNQRQAKAQQRAKRERQQRLETAVQQLEKLKAERTTNKRSPRASTSDPEARVMKRPGGGFEPSYNVQVSTDAAAGLIVGVGVTQSGADAPHLVPAMERLEVTFGKLPKQVVADAGYISNQNVKALAERTDLIGPLQTANPARVEGARKRRGITAEFTNEKFVYQPDADCFHCPEGKTLCFYKTEDNTGGLMRTYRAQAADCSSCPSKTACCPKSPARQIRHLEEDLEITEFRQKMNTAEKRKIYQQRSQVAEFPYAWIKEKLKLRQFHVRGLRKVTLEALWAALTYDIQQWIRLRWRTRLQVA